MTPLNIFPPSDRLESERYADSGSPGAKPSTRKCFRPARLSKFDDDPSRVALSYLVYLPNEWRPFTDVSVLTFGNLLCCYDLVICR